ncbi:unnamed protein product, partial [Ectocarpus sp. 13 AM-2016]
TAAVAFCARTAFYTLLLCIFCLPSYTINSPPLAEAVAAFLAAAGATTPEPARAPAPRSTVDGAGAAVTAAPSLPAIAPSPPSNKGPVRPSPPSALLTDSQSSPFPLLSLLPPPLPPP